MKFSIWYIIIGLVILLLSAVVFYWFFSGEDEIIVEEDYYDTLPVVSNASDSGRVSLLEIAEPYTNSFESLQEYFYSDKYSIFLCKEDDDQEQVLIMPARYQVVDDEYTLALVKRVVEEWSQNMIGDVGNIIYPKIVLGETFPSANFLKFGDVYVAEFTIIGQEYEIAYTWMNNFLVIASSLECVDELEHTYHSH